jgi:hypothetical protein
MRAMGCGTAVWEAEGICQGSCLYQPVLKDDSDLRVKSNACFVDKSIL